MCVCCHAENAIVRIVTNSADSPQKTKKFFEVNSDKKQLKAIETNGIKAVSIGTGLWLFALACLFLARDWLKTTNHDDWLWICAAGALLGIFGQFYTRRRAKKVAADTWHTKN